MSNILQLSLISTYYHRAICNRAIVYDISGNSEYEEAEARGCLLEEYYAIYLHDNHQYYKYYVIVLQTAVTVDNVPQKLHYSDNIEQIEMQPLHHEPSAEGFTHDGSSDDEDNVHDDTFNRPTKLSHGHRYTKLAVAEDDVDAAIREDELKEISLDHGVDHRPSQERVELMADVKNAPTKNMSVLRTLLSDGVVVSLIAIYSIFSFAVIGTCLSKANVLFIRSKYQIIIIAVAF